jgi:hypothetical protein
VRVVEHPRQITVQLSFGWSELVLQIRIVCPPVTLGDAINGQAIPEGSRSRLNGNHRLLAFKTRSLLRHRNRGQLYVEMEDLRQRY